ncbi:MAG TPA: hypothetical protein VEJ67_15460 [Candidatus Cybelea sp.]|nr:hypothetical protein [Candidatus Cybelea sp.]
MANISPFKLAYRILTWSTFAVLLITLVLAMRKSPAPNVPYDSAAAVRVEQKFAAADQAKAAGEPAQVELDRTELNSYLKDNLAIEGQAIPENGSSARESSGSGNATSSTDPAANIAGAEQPTVEQVQSSVKDVKVDMDGDLVRAYVIFDFHGKDLSLELDGHLSAEGGYLHFDPVAGKLGSLPLPQSTLDAAVERLMTSPENREKLRLPADISDIQIVNGQAVVTYR